MFLLVPTMTSNSAAALGIIALTNTAEEAFAGGLERPSAKGLAETSINVSFRLGSSTVVQGVCAFR